MSTVYCCRQESKWLCPFSMKPLTGGLIELALEVPKGGSLARATDMPIELYQAFPTFTLPSHVAWRLAENIVVPCGALMVFHPDFSLSGLFGCHVAWRNIGAKFFWFLGARQFLCEFFPPNQCQV